jgi:hypothetical protein
MSVGLAAIGTIGLILEAARSKRVSVDEALRALEHLPDKGRLHVTPELLARAIAANLGAVRVRRQHRAARRATSKRKNAEPAASRRACAGCAAFDD